LEKFYLSGKATSLCLILKTTQAGKTLLLCVSFAHPSFQPCQQSKISNEKSLSATQKLTSSQRQELSSSKPASSSSVTSVLFVGSPTFDWLGAGSYDWYGSTTFGKPNSSLQYHCHSQKTLPLLSFMSYEYYK